MNILFTYEYPELLGHSGGIINWLTHRGHNISIFCHRNYDMSGFINFCKHSDKVRQITNPVFKNYDLWIYDITPYFTGVTNQSELEKIYYSESIFLNELMSFENNLMCINFEDGFGFFSHRVTQCIIDRTIMFLNTCLLKDRNLYPNITDKSKLVVIPSYTEQSQNFKDNLVEYSRKTNRVYFSGSLTGHPTILTRYSEEERWHRIIIANKIRSRSDINSILRFHNCDPSYQNEFNKMDMSLKGMPVPYDEFVHELTNSKISLALHGNVPNTRRFHESLAAGCLTMTPPIDSEIEVYGYGIPGVHYVEIDVLGNDILEKIDYYLNNEKEASVIATNGRKYWEEYSMMDDGLFSKRTNDYLVEKIVNKSGLNL